VINIRQRNCCIHRDMPWTKVIVFWVLLSWGGVSLHSADQPPLDEPKSFARRAFGKAALARAGISTGIGYLSNSPREWGRLPGGVGKRFASAMGKHLINCSVQLGVAAV